MGSSRLCADNRFTGRERVRFRLKLLLFLFAIPVLCAFSLMLGPSGIGLPDMSLPEGASILSLRLGRMLMGLFVGAALSASGVVFQALLRNPLAEPYVLGVSGGAGLGATVSILAGSSFALTLNLPLTAFVCALLTLMLVYGIASQGSGGSPSVYSLILSGVIVSAICSSLIMFLVSTASVEGLHNVIWWMLGNLQPVSLEQQAFSSVLVLFGIAGVWLFAGSFNAMTLGREMAHYQGINVRKVTMAGLLLATLLAATAVSMAGISVLSD
jgi:iron complex transport system permease protein